MLRQVVERNPLRLFEHGQPEQHGDPEIRHGDGNAGPGESPSPSLSCQLCTAIQPVAIIWGRCTALSVQNSGAAASRRSPAESGSISPTWRPRASQSAAGIGQCRQSIGDGAGENEVLLDPLPIAFVERSLMGLTQRLGTDPLPERVPA